MKTYTCLVIDDEVSAIETLEGYIKQTPGLAFVDGLQDSDEAKDFFLKKTMTADIIFLDLEMHGTTGEELAEILKGQTMIIFTTGHADFAVQSYEYGAIDFLLKPFSYERFVKAVDKCKSYTTSTANLGAGVKEEIPINDSRKGRIVIVDKADIISISAFGNYCKIHLKDGDHLMPLKSLVSIYEELHSDLFLRVHRCWVINIKYIKTHNKNFVTLRNGEEIKLGRVHKAGFRKWLGRHGLS